MSAQRSVTAMARGVLRTALSASVAWAAVAPLSAQQARDDLRVTVRGRVLDGVSDAPVHGAFVAPEGSDTGYLTDDDGTFVLRVPRSRTAYHLQVENLGYRTVRLSIPAEEVEGSFIVLRIEPDPVVLEGLQVMADRFRSRRRATAISARAYDREDLLRTTAFDAVDYLRFHSGIATSPCGLEICVMSRGRWVRPAVYIDERPSLSGLDELTTYRPQDLHMIEVFANGRMIRAYTEHFMARYAKSGRRLQPLPIFF